MLRFLEKNIKWINVILSAITIICIFAILKPTFLVQANILETETINTNIVDGETKLIPQDKPQNMELVKWDESKEILLTNKSIKLTPNIVITKTIVTDSKTATIVSEDDNWYTVVLNGQLLYVSKMELASLPKVEIVEVNTSTIIESEQPQKEEIPNKPESSNIQTSPAAKPETQPDYTVTKTDMTQYVTTDGLNVRTGPSTNYEKIGVLSLNNEVHVIGIVDNGWTQIEYNGETAFVSSKYLSDNKVEISYTSSGNKLENYPNAYGILKIPSIGVDVVMYDRSIAKNSQDIVDKKNSAAYLWAVEYYGFDVIADHKHQGFSAIANAIPYSTVATLILQDGERNYICVDKFVGVNTGSWLIDSNGDSIVGRNDGGICMYTCYPAHPDIMITFWQPC